MWQKVWEMQQEGKSQFEILLESLQGKKQSEVLNALRNEGDFTKKELRLIKFKFEEHSKVVNWAEKRLERM